jgi:glycosyltransferase involved in cell wall biosynthesis
MTADRTMLAAVPVHNGAAWIGQAVQSLLDQTVPPTRILVIDDGSTEDIAAALAPFGDAVEYCRQEQAGPVAARNRAISACHEELIVLLDADDRYEPRRIEAALATMERDPAVSGTVCLAQNRRPDGTPVGDPKPAYTLGALVALRTAFERAGLPDASLQHGAALEWFLRAKESGVKIVVDDEPLLSRLLRKDSFSHSNSSASLQEHLRIVRATLAKRKANGELPEERNDTGT